MKYIRVLLLLLCMPGMLKANQGFGLDQGKYQLVISGFDWGPAVHKVILESDGSDFDPADFEIFVQRSSKQGEIPEGQRYGKRTILYAYPSDKDGGRKEDGSNITLVLQVSPVLSIASPIQYMRVGNQSSNVWIEYNLTILNHKTGKIWDTETGRAMPIVDEFDLDGKFSHGEIALRYAYFQPKEEHDQLPLIIWLHGGGEGGVDTRIPLLANRAANYASEDIQRHFGGMAYVLVPQTPTFWMQAADGMYTRGDREDIYHEALFELIKDFVTRHPEIDPTKIYLGGCSNGGYMSLKLIMEHPDYFAAGYISALAYFEEYVTDAQIQRIKDVPMWFVHSADDGTTKANQTVVPLYKRLKNAGAKDVILSLYDHVTDITGFYGGKDFRYPGHFSWIYSHADKASFDYDGTPVYRNGKEVTIMEWLSQQHKK